MIPEERKQCTASTRQPLLPKAEFIHSEGKVCRNIWDPSAQDFSSAVTILDTSATAENPEGNSCCRRAVSRRKGATQGFRGANVRRLVFQAYQLNVPLCKIRRGSLVMRHHAPFRRNAHIRPRGSTTAEPSCAREANSSKPPMYT